MDLAFKLWLVESEKHTAIKEPLFPKGYAGLGMYPWCYYTPISGEILTYLKGEDAKFKFKNRKLWPGDTDGEAEMGDKHPHEYKPHLHATYQHEPLFAGDTRRQDK
jgi:hypothetical protein